MKHLCTGILLTLFVWTSVPSPAQNSLFKPFTGLRVIQTEHFDIIFPKESEPSARLLASYADRVYDHVSSLLGIEVPGRIPVTFTPHTDMFNGYYAGAPIPRIMLFDTPMNLEWTAEADNLESLFLHELTHAVSLNSRSPEWQAWHRIFGIFTPTLFTAPLFMVEGVTVSFESLSGFARANDPLIKQKLRQAVYEGKFLTPFQASGVYDVPGQESMIYEYGGPFSAWLQRTYGMEKYAELWQAMGGQLYYISLFVYREGFYGIFKSVYDLDFLDAWNAFKDTMDLGVLEENPGEVLPKRHRFFSERERFIDALAARGNSLYFLNNSEGKVRVYDTRTGRTRSFSTGSVYSFDLDVSADNTKLLLSSYRFNSADRAVATVTELRTNSGLRTGRSIRGLARARYFRDGIIGLSPELHNTCIAYQEFNGKKEILVRGNENFVFSGPQAVDNERIVFVASRHGVRELWLYNYVSRELFRIEDGHNGHWPQMRGLGVSGGKLFFSHNADDRMYKLASIDLETMQAVYSDRDFSGGVSIPVEADGAVYYRGSFFSRDTLLRFPEPADSLSGTQTTLKLVKLNTNNFEIITDQNNDIDIEMIAASDVPDDSSLLTVHSSLLTDNPSLLIPTPYDTHSPPYSGPSKPYIGIRYMNPLKYWWAPWPLIRAGDAARNDWGISLDGVGLYTIMADAADRNLLTIIAYADIPYKMANIEQIAWRNTFLGVPLAAVFSDRVTESARLFYRYTGTTLGAGLQWSTGGWFNGFSPAAGYARIADDDGSRESAYYWKETGSYFLFQADYTLSNLRKRPNEMFGTGLTFFAGGITIANEFKPRAEGGIRTSAETRFPMDLTLFGGYDSMGMDLHGESRLYADRPSTDYTLTEYPHPKGLDLSWLAGGTASLGLFSFEIQNHLSHLYFNRFFGILSVGNVLYDSKGHPDANGIAINDDLRLIQSLRLKLGMKMSVLPVLKQPLSIEPYVWGAWKFSNTITGKNGLWDIMHIDGGINISF